MFFKESEIQARLSSQKNLAVKMGIIEPASEIEAVVEELPSSNISEVRRMGPGRPPGKLNRSDIERAVIAETAAIVGASEAAKIHDCSQSQAHSYAHGFNTCAQRNPNGAVGESAINSIEAVRQRAIDKILMAMDLITEEKLDNQTPTALSQVAANLSKIPSSLESKGTDDINRGNTVNVVVYSPPTKDEKQYKTIKIA